MLHEGFDEFKLSGGVPTPSGVGLAILRCTQGDEVGLESLIQCLEVDPASVLRVLKAANARCAPEGVHASSVFAAAVALGPRELRAAALGFSLLSSNRTSLCDEFDYEGYWSWSLAAAFAARMLAEECHECDPGEAHACTLVAHVGELALACAHPQAYTTLRRSLGNAGTQAQLDAERRAFEIHRWEVSAALIGESGLPPRFAAAVLALGRASDPGAVEDDDTAQALALLVESGTLAAEWIAGPRLEPGRRAQVWDQLVALAANLSLGEERLGSALARAEQAWRDKRRIYRIQPGDEAVVAATPASRPSVEHDSAGAGPVKVLVVDDDAKLRRLVSHLLRDVGYQVLEADDGEEGLSLALQESPHIVVTDWAMPGMSGVELCRTLRRMESGRRTFLLVLTAKEDEERVLDAFNAGADDYVTKPFNPRILQARVQAGRRLIELQQQVESDKVERLRQVADMGLMTRKLRTAALTDFLTDLPNRRYAIGRLEQEWLAADRLGRPLSVVLLDIDHFKRINDEHGHDVGDLVLKSTADALRAKTRRGDVVCRLGGEEFLVINVNSDLDGAWRCAERLRTAVESNRLRAGSFEGIVTVSLGVAQRKAGMRGPQVLLKAADAAVYEAKAAGRNTIRGERPPSGQRESA